MKRQISQKYHLYKGATKIAESTSGFDILEKGQKVIEKHPDEQNERSSKKQGCWSKVVNYSKQK